MGGDRHRGRHLVRNDAHRANPLGEVRKTLGLPVRQDKKGDPPRHPGTDAEFEAARARLRPELVAGIGLAAILILVWLMELKPF